MMYAAGNKTLVLDFLASFAVRLMRGTAALSGQLLRKACAEAGLEPEDYPEFVQQVGERGQWCSGAARRASLRPACCCRAHSAALRCAQEARVAPP